MAPKFCANCGSKLDAITGIQFCSECGHKILYDSVQNSTGTSELYASTSASVTAAGIHSTEMSAQRVTPSTSDDKGKGPVFARPSFWLAVLAFILAASATGAEKYVGISSFGYGFFHHGHTTCTTSGAVDSDDDTTNDNSNDENDNMKDNGRNDDDTETGVLSRVEESYECSSATYPGIKCVISCSETYTATTVIDGQGAGTLTLEPSDGPGPVACTCYQGSGSFNNVNASFHIAFENSDVIVQAYKQQDYDRILLSVGLESGDTCDLTYTVGYGEVLGISSTSNMRTHTRQSLGSSESTCASSLKYRCKAGAAFSVLVNLVIGAALLLAIIFPVERAWFNISMLAAALCSSVVWALVITLTKGSDSGAFCAPLKVGSDGFNYEASFGCMITATVLCLVSVFVY